MTVYLRYSMKICQVSYYADATGSGVAADRLAGALRAHTDVNVLFAAVEPGRAKNVIPLASPLRKKIMRMEQALLWRVFALQHSRNCTAHTFNFFRQGAPERILALKPDIVHLHGVVGEMLSIGEIAALSRATRLVWTLHDCWPFTGTEQYPLAGSERFRNGYVKENPDDPGLDVDRFFWGRKRRLWRNMSCRFIAPSTWMAGEMQRSKLWDAACVDVIGNSIDTDFFSPGNRLESREQLGLPVRPFLLGFGASSIDHPNKGGTELQILLQKLKDLPIELVTVGQGRLETPLPTHSLGVLRDAHKLRDFYRACDLFVSTSKYDNLPNMILESMSCGTPVAAFGIGGIPDLVTAETGLSVAAIDPEGLAGKIRAYIFASSPLGAEARKHICSMYNAGRIARMHLDLYRKML